MPHIFTDEEHRQWLAGLPKKSVGVKAIIKSNQGNILIVKPSYRPKWQLPGGVVEKEEDPPKAIIREIKEEVDLTVQENELRLIGTVFRSEYDNLVLMYEYLKSVSEKEKVRVQDEEIEGYMFVDPTSLVDYLPNQYRPFWNRYTAQ